MHRQKINKYGHRLNIRKTYYGMANDFPIITGVAISPNGEIKVPNIQRYKIIKSLKEIKHSKNNSLIGSTKGSIITAQQTEDTIF